MRVGVDDNPSDWYEIDEVAPRVWRIRERHYREDYRCNMYLVKGMMRDILVDAGLGLVSLSRFARSLSRDPLLVLTHAHYDHIGSAHEFSERAIHPSETQILANPTRENTYADLLLSGADFAQPPFAGFDADLWQPTPAPATRVLEEGDVVDLGDRAFKVLSTPGHSWGSICLWDERNRMLISGDSVYAGELFDQLSCSDIPTYTGTMDRLRVLPVDTALPGHGAVLNGHEFRRIATEYVATNTKLDHM